MDLSPNDIRTYEFPNQMRGYDKDEVDNFLEQIAVAMEGLKQDNLKLSMEMDSVKTQLAGLRQFEDAIKNAAIDARRNADTTMATAKEEAEELLDNAQKEAKQLLGSRSEQIDTLEKQMGQLKNTRNSYLTRMQAMIESHLEIIREIAEDEPSAAKGLGGLKRSIEVLETSEIDTAHQETRTQVLAKNKGTAESTTTSSDDKSSESGSVDPELAAALQTYKHSNAGSEQPVQPEVSPAPEAPTQGPGSWTKTTARAEEVPTGFVAGPPANEPMPAIEKEISTDKVNVDAKENLAPEASDSPTEHNSINIDQKQDQSETTPNIAHELDRVAAKFEEEMDKADKN